jgi:predicted nuclease with TOPRIM domain
MHRTSLAYFRDERARLVERYADVKREQSEVRSRLVDLEREAALLDELLASLDAHVPDVEKTDITPITKTA